MSEEQTDKILTRAEELQKEMHTLIGQVYARRKPIKWWQIFSKPAPTYQDHANVFFLAKIAQLEAKINEPTTH